MRKCIAVFGCLFSFVGAGLAEDAKLVAGKIEPDREFKFECTVVTLDGKPAPNAEMRVWVEESKRWHLATPLIASGKTDAEGLFKASFPVRSYWSMLPCTALAQIPGVGIGFQELYGQEPWTKPGSAKIVLHKAGDLKVRVLQPGGTPAEGLHLWVGGCELGTLGDTLFPNHAGPPYLSPHFWSGTTDHEGRCVIPFVPAGARIYLSHDGPEYARFPGWYNSGEWFKADTGEHTLTLQTAGILRGRIVTSEGTAVPGAAVSIIEKTPYVTAYGDSVLTDAEGRFCFRQIPGSTYQLSLSLQPPALDQWISADKEDVVVRTGAELDMGDWKLVKVAIVTAQVVNKETGEEIEKPLVFRLAPGSHEVNYRSERVFPKGFETTPTSLAVQVTVREGDRLSIYFKLTPDKAQDKITGTVLGIDGRPLADASVVVAGVWSRGFGGSETTDASGNFSAIAAADSGAYVLFAWSKDHAMSELISPKRGEKVTVRLKKEGFSSLSGRVKDDKGDPVKGARVALSRDGISLLSSPFPQCVEADAEGRFSFPQVWNNQTYRLSCGTEGYGVVYKNDVKVASGTHDDSIEFKIAKANASAFGVVLDAAGKPLADAWVRGSGQGQPSNMAVKSDKEGRFRFEHVVKGKLAISVWINTGDYVGRAETKVNVGDHNDEVRIQLPASAKGELAGVVQDESGHGIVNAKIWSEAQQGASDAQGKFQLKGFDKGWVDLDFTANDQDRGPRTKRVRVKVGAKDLRVVVPDKEPPVEEWSETPVNMIGKMAPPIETAFWFNSEPLGAVPSGKVRITDFWNTRCGPCAATLPKIQKFWEQHHTENLEIVSLHAPNPEEEVREFVEKRHYTFPVAISSEGSRAYRAFDIRYNPVYVVTDVTGKIVSYGSDWAAASKKALELLAK